MKIFLVKGRPLRVNTIYLKDKMGLLHFILSHKPTSELMLASPLGIHSVRLSTFTLYVPCTHKTVRILMISMVPLHSSSKCMRQHCRISLRLSTLTIIRYLIVQSLKFRKVPWYIKYNILMWQLGNHRRVKKQALLDLTDNIKIKNSTARHNLRVWVYPHFMDKHLRSAWQSEVGCAKYRCGNSTAIFT